MDLVARVWVPTERNWITSSELLQAVTVALDRAGLEFPAPKLDVRVVGGTEAAAMPGG